jgi:hypothetical protein
VFFLGIQKTFKPVRPANGMYNGELQGYKYTYLLSVVPEAESDPLVGDEDYLTQLKQIR